MTKQMNEYLLLVTANADAFNAQLSQWVSTSGAAADVIRSEPRHEHPAVSIVCTEEIARQVAETFADRISGTHLHRENVVTLPAPLPKKIRRPGFGP
jgi:hypothetical protein